MKNEPTAVDVAWAEKSSGKAMRDYITGANRLPQGRAEEAFSIICEDIKAKFGVNLVSFHLVVWVGNEEGDKDTQQRAQTEEDIRESVKLYPEVELDVPAGELTQEIAQYVRNRVIEAGENPPKVAEVIEKMRQSFMLI